MRFCIGFRDFAGAAEPVRKVKYLLVLRLSRSRGVLSAFLLDFSFLDVCVFWAILAIFRFLAKMRGCRRLTQSFIGIMKFPTVAAPPTITFLAIKSTIDFHRRQFDHNRINHHFPENPVS